MPENGGLLPLSCAEKQGDRQEGGHRAVLFFAV